MAVFAITIFAGAFLLFQVQPLIAKFVLPWFGGSPGVWAVCVLFFQGVLLAGYAYAHVTCRRLAPRRQVILHLGLLAAALASLPIIPSEAWKPAGAANPTFGILALLSATIGLPYLVLSSTGPLMQEWFRQTHPGKSPYRLYALSNVASLAALLTYPVLVEPRFTRQAQAHGWGVGLAIFALAAAAAGLKLWRANPPPPVATAGTDRAKPAAAVRFLWFSLPACASILLLAITNKMCQDVAVVPFLWVLPLAVYLLTFVICFDSPRWYRRSPFAVGLVASLIGLCWAIFDGEGSPIPRQIAIYGGALFGCCMVCHGELYRLRPRSGDLTAYYLMIAAGGAAGGLFVAVLAPLLFTGFWELPWGMLLCAILFLVVCVRARDDAPDAPRPRSATAPDPQPALSGPRRAWNLAWRLGCWRWLCLTLPLLCFAGLDGLVREGRARFHHVPASYFLGLRLCLAVLALSAIRWWVLRVRDGTFRFWRFIACAWLALGCLALGRVLWVRTVATAGDVVERQRDFYGVLTTYLHFKGDAEEEYLLLQHGRITHGLQFTRPPRRTWATSYYGEGSGIAEALKALPSGPRRIGAVGLGTGSIAALTRPGDSLRFYEINPQVRELAWRSFYYLKDAQVSGTAINVILGDARLSLEREQPQGFDLLALDAFSSDSIPVHLLTREAFAVYDRQLRTNGIIAIHISNRFLDLEPVVADLAREFHYSGRVVEWEENEDDWWLYASTWVVLSRDEARLKSPGLIEGRKLAVPSDASQPRWTDDFASLYQILRR